jgi:hypothetical protein
MEMVCAAGGRRLPTPDEWPSLPGQAEETDAPPGWEPDQALQPNHGWDEPAQPSQQLNVGAKDFSPPGQLAPYGQADSMAAAAYVPYVQQPPPQVCP